VNVSRVQLERTLKAKVEIAFHAPKVGILKREATPASKYATQISVQQTEFTVCP
jgi:intracellular sulfur oxidation DsrE/DsrF family protein